ncbi:MAG TPA: nitroreductase family deazaflavin-dependent oxidoreductase, partial [Segeticoccus sp.]|nr:nitroreductase family deazaflavin-dependent oxidoreductase [Segeticoccus sp.]
MTPSPPARLVKVSTPVMRRAAGHRLLPIWAVLRHVGRTSGATYEIPIAVLVTPDSFVIGMPWG